MSGHASWVLGVSFAPDGRKFASSSSDLTVKVWELAKRQCLHTFHEHNDQVSFFYIIEAIFNGTLDTIDLCKLDRRKEVYFLIFSRCGQ